MPVTSLSAIRRRMLLMLMMMMMMINNQDNDINDINIIIIPCDNLRQNPLQLLSGGSKVAEKVAR